MFKGINIKIIPKKFNFYIKIIKLFKIFIFMINYFEKININLFKKNKYF